MNEAMGKWLAGRHRPWWVRLWIGPHALVLTGLFSFRDFGLGAHVAVFNGVGEVGPSTVAVVRLTVQFLFPTLMFEVHFNRSKGD